MTYPSDAHKYGFLLAEIVPWLREQDVQIQQEISAKPEYLTPNYAIEPDLENPIFGYTVNDAASLILGFNSGRRDNRIDSSNMEFAKERNKIARSMYVLYSEQMKSQQEEVSSANIAGSLFDKIFITAAEAENWCNQNGCFWCVPTKRQTKVSDIVMSNIDASALQNEIHELKDRLKNEADNHTFLRKAAEERDSLKAEHLALAALLSENQAKLLEANTTIEALNADLIGGKSKSFMLELLGGLATSLLYVDIFKKGNIEVGTVTSALEQVGLKPTPEVVSRYLKEAANRLVESEKADSIIKYLENNKNR